MKTLVIGEALDLHKLALPAGFTSCAVAGTASQQSRAQISTFFLSRCVQNKLSVTMLISKEE